MTWGALTFGMLIACAGAFKAIESLDARYAASVWASLAIFGGGVMVVIVALVTA